MTTHLQFVTLRKTEATMDDYMTMQDTSDYDHSQWMRWVHDEQGTVEVLGVLNDES